jgi:iron complex transport system substrate-binding protein
LLSRLAPDLILTQGLCEVCAVGDGEVHRLAQALDPGPTVIGLEATGLDGIWQDIRRVAAALDLAPEAEELIAGLTYRLRRIRPPESPTPPRVLCVEWLDPLYLAGHWVPEMVEAAGARDVGADPGAPSRRGTWTEVEGLRPDLVLVMLCGFDVPRAIREMEEVREPAALGLFRDLPTWVLDGNAYTSRPGPRVVDGAERIRAALEGRALSGLERWEPRHG